MKILLLDADNTGFPNLALMQMSALFKSQHHQVFLNSSSEKIDQVYVSCVFTWNREKAISSTRYYPDAEVFYGGTGFNKTSKIPEEAQHLKPDYNLYPKIDYSLGFATRGCIRNSDTCPWCVVPEKEGMIHQWSFLSDFVEPSFNKIMLLDNNLLSYRGHMDILSDLINLGKKVCITQANDIRLVTPENAELLAQLRYYDTKFNARRLYFSWDRPDIEKAVLKGIEILLDIGINPDHIMFYVLIGCDTNYEEDLHRVKTLIDLGVKPYVMLYNNMKGTYHHHLKRWIERRYYEIKPWEEYDHGDSQRWIQDGLLNKNTEQAVVSTLSASSNKEETEK